jgi:hypothetical protein
MVLVVALVLPPPAAGLDVKLWPFFRYARDERLGVTRWTALGPLIEFKRTPEFRELYVRPLLHLVQRRGAQHDDRAEILYPIAASRWREDHQSFRFLLYTYRKTPPADAPHAPGEPPAPEQWRTRSSLFPFFFFRRDPERGAQLSVLPFYLDLDDVLGYERVTAVMFPAYLRLREPRVERRYYGFPFVSTVGGPDGDGVRVWPFCGDTEVAGRERSRYVLWPFHIRTERLVPGYGWEARRINFPVFGAIDGAGRTTRTWGVLAYTHTVDERRGLEATGSPWPLVVRQRRLGEDAYGVWRAFPVYGRSDVGGVSSRFYAWPSYRRRTQAVDDFHYERRDVGLVLWRRQALDSELTGRHERLLTLFPGLRREQEEGRYFGQVPALADSLMPKNRGVLAMWAPLYGLFRWDTRPDGTRDWNAVWGLVAREEGRLLGPWRLETAPPAAEEVSHGG